MNSYHQALDQLCNRIIENASSTRGKPRHKRPERREEHPTHVPHFFDIVCVAHYKLAHGTLEKIQDQKYFLILILHLALHEAKSRRPYGPAYFDYVLSLCEEFKPEALAEWFRDALDEDSPRWHPLTGNYIRLIATKVFGYEPVT